MSETSHVWDQAKMREKYGGFFLAARRIELCRSKVAQELWPLLPYAAFWGIADDWARDDLVNAAPAHVRQNLRDVVAAYANALNEWLAGPEADEPSPSNEYIAFSAMRMAADVA